MFLRTDQLSFLFTLAVMVCVRFGGVLAGAIATGLGILAGIVVFLSPAHNETERLASGHYRNPLICSCRAGYYLAGSATSRGKTTRGRRVGTGPDIDGVVAHLRLMHEGRWQQLERYISLHSDAKFTHGLCEECGGRMEADRQALKWQPQQQFLPVSDALSHDNCNISNPAAAVGPPVQ